MTNKLKICWLVTILIHWGFPKLLFTINVVDKRIYINYGKSKGVFYSFAFFLIIYQILKGLYRFWHN